MAKKDPVVDINAEYPEYEVLFDVDGGLNSLGKRFLKGLKPFVKISFVIAYQCGYEYSALTDILACKTERECEHILVTQRIKSCKFGRTEILL